MTDCAVISDRITWSERESATPNPYREETDHA